MNTKHPWLAAILNFVVPGAGYLYAGTRVKFGILLIAAMILVLFGPTPGYTEEVDAQTLAADPSTIVMGIAGLMVSIGFAYDAYIDVKHHNDSLGEKLKKDAK